MVNIPGWLIRVGGGEVPWAPPAGVPLEDLRPWGEGWRPPQPPLLQPWTRPECRELQPQRWPEVTTSWKLVCWIRRHWVLLVRRNQVCTTTHFEPFLHFTVPWKSFVNFWQGNFPKKAFTYSPSSTKMTTHVSLIVRSL